MRMTLTIVRSILLSASVLTLSACASSGNGAIKTTSSADAQALIEIGKSTKADIKNIFGEANVTKFDNGYEEWLYQDSEKINRAILYVPIVGLAYRAFGPFAGNTKEVAILFDPNGVVKKYAFKDRTV